MYPLWYTIFILLNQNQITVEAVINAPVEKVWRYFTEPAHITKWNNASPDWHTPRAENDLRVGGSFNYRMEAKDGREGFDFTGTYDEVLPQAKIVYTMTDGRRVENIFKEEAGMTRVVVTFEPETENTLELQRAGWQAILDNFKKYSQEQ